MQGEVSYSSPAVHVVQEVQVGLEVPPQVPVRYCSEGQEEVQLVHTGVDCAVHWPEMNCHGLQLVVQGVQASKVVVSLKVLAGQAMHWRSLKGPQGKAGLG